MHVLLALLLAASPISSRDHGCAGGAMIFFTPGSDRLSAPAVLRLTNYATASHQQNADSQIYIESGGDGPLSAFDEALSRRRSETIRAFLVARGLRPDRIHIEVRDVYGAEPARGTPDDPYPFRLGHVYELVSLQEYRRLYPPGVIAECF